MFSIINLKFGRLLTTNLNSNTCIMDLFFSPPVRSYSALIPHYQACEKVDTLIATGYIQFQLQSSEDSKDPYYLIYSRIRTLKHRLEHLIKDIQQKYHEPLRTLSNDQKIITIAKMKQFMAKKQIDHLKYLDIQESWIEKKLSRFNELSKNYDRIETMLRTSEQQIDTLRAKLQICKNKNYQSQQFVLIHGICANKDKAMVERIIFRKTRGHSYVIFKNRPVVQYISDNDTSIILCFISKGVYKHIGDKIMSICTLNNINLYELPNLQSHIRTYQKQLLQKRKQLVGVLQLSGIELTRVLSENVGSQEQALRHHLTRICYLQRIIYIICHSKHVGTPANHILLTMHLPLSQMMPNLGVPVIHTNKHKRRTIIPRLPCLYQVNMLTELFSIPKHNQILPSIFMFTTVPILFGMMFSDIGHGLMLLTICKFLKLGPMFYLMAFMSIYCGCIYNQFFGMKVVRWSNLGIVQAKWGISQNGLNFENSLKMKISMIIAFVHMLFGGVLKIVNEIKRKQFQQIKYDSLPKLGLLITTVGYMDFLIILKWLTDFTGRQYQAPSIINCVLQLYLGWNQTRKYSVYSSIQTQKSVGFIILCLNVFCIGIMFYNQTVKSRVQALFSQFSKVGLRNRKNRYQKISQPQPHEILVQQNEDDFINSQISEELQKTALTSAKSEHQQLQDYYIQTEVHQSQLGPLQIFEYVLSLISSTTSYLRLFALSLAHAKLSHLLLGFLLGSLSDYNPSISILRCLVFFISTCGLMLALDVMQCMMHVVRLHWVQWMGKFYTGNGILFKPQIQQNYQ